jgi:hypothetical protein
MLLTQPNVNPLYGGISDFLMSESRICQREAGQDKVETVHKPSK